MEWPRLGDISLNEPFRPHKQINMEYIQFIHPYAVSGMEKRTLEMGMEWMEMKEQESGNERKEVKGRKCYKKKRDLTKRNTMKR